MNDRTTQRSSNAIVLSGSLLRHRAPLISCVALPHFYCTRARPLLGSLLAVALTQNNKQPQLALAARIKQPLSGRQTIQL